MNYKNIFTYTVLIFLSITLSYSQGNYELMTISFEEYGNQLRYPFAGGLELSQFSSADLNNDGIDDLIIFDKEDNDIITFINGGSPNTVDYDYAPEYAINFPNSLMDWALLKDFNCDGIADLFASNSFEVHVYEGYYNGSNQLDFNLFKAPLRYDNNTEILEQVYEDIPGIEDMNGDGDLDLLINNNTPGDFYQYFENQSVELGYGCDSLIYDMTEYCWGEIYSLSNTIKIDTCPLTPPMMPDSDYLLIKNMHFQKNTLPIDIDGDGDKDVLMGTNLGPELYLLINDGDNNFADVNNYELTFPSTNPVTLDYQPSAFYLDIDNDGTREMINSKMERGRVALDNTIWMYENINTNNDPTFSFSQDQFMVNEMIDVGREAAPVFWDYNNDGLQDLLVANLGFTDISNDEEYTHIFVYENVGTSTTPSFSLVDEDFANMSSYQLTDMHICFGDLDGDGDDDMVAGEKEGLVFYFENSGGSFNLDVLALSNLDAGQNSAPQLFDYDDDNDLDLLVGAKDGKVKYYENTGSATNFDFSGGLSANSVGGIYNDQYAVPFFTKWGDSDEMHLFTSYNNTDILLHNNFDIGFPGGVANGVSTSFLNIVEDDLRLAIHGADITGDGVPEFAVGNIRGGLRIYTPNCPAPTNLTTNNLGNTGIQFNWASTNNNFDIEYRLVGNTTWTSVPVNSGNTYNLTGLDSCSDYEWRIRASCSSGNSFFSPSQTFSTPNLSAAWNTPSTITNCDAAINLTSNIAGTSGGSWFGGSYINSNGMFDPSGLSPGNYNISYSVGSPVCDTQTYSITVSSGPNAAFNPNTLSACDNPLNLNPLITGTLGGSWSGTNVSGNQFDPNGLSAGTYPVTYTVGSGSCSSSDTQFITVTNGPTASWETTSLADCDVPINLNPLITGTTGGSWSGGSYISGNQFNPNGLSAGNYSVTYTINAGNCSETYTDNITVTNGPSADWDAITLYECDSPIDLNPLITGTNGGSWSGGSYIFSNQFNPAGLSPGNYSVTYSVGSGSCTNAVTDNIEVDACSVRAKIKCLLEGPYNSTTGLMATDLYDNNLLPLSQPYNVAPWNHNPASPESVSSYSTIPTNTVDWVLIELRDTDAAYTLLASTTGFLLDDGTIVDLNGINGVVFEGFSTDNYNIVVRHRNHMAVMTANSLSLPNISPYDFSTNASQASGWLQQENLGGNYGLYGGDMNADGVFTVIDFNIHLNNASDISVYDKADINMDTIVTVEDYNIYRKNASITAITVLRY